MATEVKERSAGMTKQDIAQHVIDALIEKNRDMFTVSSRMVLAGARSLRRKFPSDSRRWFRWKSWWLGYLAERNGEWATAVKALRRITADRGIKGKERVEAYTALARVLEYVPEAKPMERIGALRSALRVGAKAPDETLFSVVSQLERLGALSSSKTCLSVFLYLVNAHGNPRGSAPRTREDMIALILKWRAQGMP